VIRLGVLLFHSRGEHSAGPARPDGSVPTTRYIAAMCGRATYKLTWEEIVALYRLTLGANSRRRREVSIPMVEAGGILCP
jgi:hypothetical protein